VPHTAGEPARHAPCDADTGFSAGKERCEEQAGTVSKQAIDHSTKETRMNKDHIKGEAKDIAGKVQEKVGEMTNNQTQQAKGLAKQAEGKVQKGVGDVKDAVHDAAKEQKDADKPARRP
jgi:uncharacterized protein YjbJ (UPF0337 family)